MSTVLCLSVGYALGSLSSSALLAKLKQVNLRKEGSGNLGATNTMLVMGFRYGLFVLIFDLMKTLLASRIAGALFPQVYLARLLAACGAVVGHIFPFYMNFRGGKGVACMGGLIITYDFKLFLCLLALCVVLMFVCNYGVIAPVTAAAIFPPVVLWQTHSVPAWLATTVVCLLVIWKHRENFAKIKAGEEIKVRTYFWERLPGRKSKDTDSDSEEA